MNQRNLIVTIVMLTLISTFCSIYPVAAQGNKRVPYGLLCDLLGGKDVRISSTRPAFSWVVPINRKSVSNQIAYQIILTSSGSVENKGQVVWDSGKVMDSSSSSIIYVGEPLKPDSNYDWMVRIWSSDRSVSGYSLRSKFRTADRLEDYSTSSHHLIKTTTRPLIVRKNGNSTFLDFGKDAFSQPHLRLSSVTGADTIQVHLGEKLDESGKIDRRPGGTIRYSLYKIPLMKGTHDYPIRLRQDRRNTGSNAIKLPDSIGEVTPFRYMEIDNYAGRISAGQVSRKVVNYPFNDYAAHFSSSDTTLNQIWELCKYSIKATSFAGIYVDGDRERIPYEADALINQLSHYAVDREFAMARKSHEYLIHNATWPTEWIMQSVMMAWNDYLYTGDNRSIKKFYKDLKAKTLLDLQDSNGLITTQNMTESIKTDIHFSGKELKDIVDWPQTGTLGLGKEDAGETDGFVFKKYNAVSNAYFYRSLVLMAQMSDAVGENKDAVFFRNKAKEVYRVYQKAFWNQDKGLYRDGIGTDHSALHTNFFALAFGLVGEKDVPSVLEFIRSRGMACSVYGSQFLLDALYDSGEAGYSFSLLTSKSKRSWYNMISVGSTITLEAWDNIYKPNQDWNHAWGAAPANLISRKLMGIEPTAPGWSRFRIKPQPYHLGSGEITVPTIKGQIYMQFKQEYGKNFKLRTTVPANTKCSIHIPIISGRTFIITERGNPVSGKLENGFFVVEDLSSGEYSYELKYD